MHSTFTAGLLGTPRRRNVFGGGAAGTRESLLLLLLVVLGVPVLVESPLSVCEDASLDAIEELPELFEAVGSGFDELFASTTMRLCSLTARIGWIRCVAESDRGPISKDAAESSAPFVTTVTFVPFSRVVLCLSTTALPFARSLANCFRCFLVR